MKRKSYVWPIVVLALLSLSQSVTRVHGQAETTTHTPIIVKRIVLTHQTGAIGLTPLFTSTKDGLYRISGYAEMTTLGTDGDICGSLYWYDDAGEQNAPLYNNMNVLYANCLGAAISTSATATTAIFAKAGQQVSFQTYLLRPISGSPEYALFITVEQL
jgi:hypothetical protein